MMNGQAVKGRALAALVGLSLTMFGVSGCSPAPSPTPTPTGSPSQTQSITPTPSPTPTAQGLKVISSVAVWANLAQMVGGTAVDSKAIISLPSQDPHSYEATVRDQLAVNQAQITVQNDAGYDDFFARLLASKPSSKDWVKVDAARTLMAGLPIRPDTNPHFWYDFAFAKKVTERLGLAIESLAPAAERSQVAQNYKTMAVRFDSLTARAANIRKTTFNQRVILTESFAGYLLDALGMRNMTPAAFNNAVEQETDAAPSVMNQIKVMIQTHEVKLVITNQQTSSGQTQQIQNWAKASGVPVVNLSELLPEHLNYFDWMNQNLDAISGAVN